MIYISLSAFNQLLKIYLFIVRHIKSINKTNRVPLSLFTGFYYIIVLMKINFLYVDYSDACSTKLYMLIGEVLYTGYGLQILAYQRSKNTSSCAVKDTHS